MLRAFGCIAFTATLLATATLSEGRRAAPPYLQHLSTHNAERARMGTPPLIWSSKLEADALRWAKQLAATNRFEHAPQKRGKGATGENLWMGTRGSYSPREMIGGWIEEKKDYVPGRFPKVSRTGRWSDVGHYTQLIWSATRELGCAVASNAQDDILVCRYFPAGNFIGDHPQGLLKKAR